MMRIKTDYCLETLNLYVFPTPGNYKINLLMVIVLSRCVVYVLNMMLGTRTGTNSPCLNPFTALYRKSVVTNV